MKHELDVAYHVMISSKGIVIANARTTVIFGWFNTDTVV